MKLRHWVFVRPQPVSPVDWMLPVTLGQRWRPGWGTFETACHICGRPVVAVARIGTVAAMECPACGYLHRPVVWESDTGRPGDGVWL